MGVLVNEPTTIDVLSQFTFMAAVNRNSSNSKASSQERFVYLWQRQPGGCGRAVPELPVPSKISECKLAGRGAKTVTVISGFQAKPETLATLLKQLKTQCSGGTVKEDTIEIQGDHSQIVQLLAQLGYKAKISGG